MIRGLCDKRYFYSAIEIATLCFAILLAFLPASFPENEQSVSNIFDKESGAVVLVGASKNKKSMNAGSGFVVRPDGVIVTNYHIVKGSKEIFIKLKDMKIFPNAVVAGFDAEADIAIIKVKALGLENVTLGDSNRVKIGERVIAIGNPLGLESTISDGLISAVRSMDNGRKLLQTSVPSSKGSSGSPLFNLKGEVVGVIVSGRFDGQNLNFAVPINSVKTILANTGYAVGETSGHRAQTPIYYSVKPKDTLYGIARQFNITVDEIVKINNLSSSAIFVGQRLMVSRHRI